jgi:hypothetical protein
MVGCSQGTRDAPLASLLHLCPSPITACTHASTHSAAGLAQRNPLCMLHSQTDLLSLLHAYFLPPCSNDIIIAWQALPGTKTALTKDKPLNPNNLVAMELSATEGECGWVCGRGGDWVGGCGWMDGCVWWGGDFPG